MTDASNLTAVLDGHWHGSNGLAFCPAHHNTRTPALSLKDGRDGKLLVQCFAGCSWQDVFAALRARGLLVGHRDRRPNPREMERRKAEERAEHRRRIKEAQRFWDRADPIAGTLGQRYLEARGISCPLPPALRFHPRCWHGPTAKCVPAMVAKVTIGSELVGVHRTFLAEPGIKAFDERSKMMLGPCAGGAVCLSNGTGPLLVAEGIETALSLLCDPDTAHFQVWAALSTSSMSGLLLPKFPGELILAPDGDTAGRKAAKGLAERAHSAGWLVTTINCPDGCDWNDVLRREMGK